MLLVVWVLEVREVVREIDCDREREREREGAGEEGLIGLAVDSLDLTLVRRDEVRSFNPGRDGVFEDLDPGVVSSE